jgi:hypothetical protein
MSSYPKIANVSAAFFIKGSCECAIAVKPNNDISENDVRSIRSYAALKVFLDKFQLNEGVCPPTKEMVTDSPFIFCFTKGTPICSGKQ